MYSGRKLMNTSRRNILKAMPALVLAPFCGAYAAEAGVTQLRINIPGPRALPFLPIELITILGIDKSLNSQLAIRYFPSGIRAVDDMLAGNAEFSAQGFTVLHGLQNKGRHIRAIAPLSGLTPPFGIVVHTDLRKQIKTVADLKGRSIGVSIGSSTSKTYLQQMIEIFLKENGVSPSEIRWVPTAQNWEGEFGALSSKSVDAVFCEEPFLTGLVNSKIGYILSDFSDPKVRGKIPGAGHLRAVISTTDDSLTKDPHHAELMVSMLRQSMEWLSKNKASEVVKRLDPKDLDEKLDLTKVLSKYPDMYPENVQFSRHQLEASAQFMRGAGIVTAENFDVYSLVNSQFAGIKP